MLLTKEEQSAVINKIKDDVVEISKKYTYTFNTVETIDMVKEQVAKIETMARGAGLPITLTVGEMDKNHVVPISINGPEYILNLFKEEEKHMTFGEAFEQVKMGKGMRLPQWKDDVVIRAQYPDESSKMTAPYLYVESRYGRVP